MKLNNEKAIRKEIEDCEKQIKRAQSLPNRLPGGYIKQGQQDKINYLMGYRDALVKVLTDD